MSHSGGILLGFQRGATPPCPRQRRAAESHCLGGKSVFSDPCRMSCIQASREQTRMLRYGGLRHPRCHADSRHIVRSRNSGRRSSPEQRQSPKATSKYAASWAMAYADVPAVRGKRYLSDLQDAVRTMYVRLVPFLTASPQY